MESQNHTCPFVLILRKKKKKRSKQNLLAFLKFSRFKLYDIFKKAQNNLKDKEVCGCFIRISLNKIKLARAFATFSCRVMRSTHMG